MSPALRLAGHRTAGAADTAAVAGIDGAVVGTAAAAGSIAEVADIAAVAAGIAEGDSLQMCVAVEVVPAVRAEAVPVVCGAHARPLVP